MDKLNRILIFVFLFITPVSFSGQGLNIQGGTFINKGSVVLKGSWINDGTCFDTCGTIAFSGTLQNIGGTVPTAFNNVSVLAGSSTTVTAAGQTLSRVLLTNGSIDGGTNFTLRSTPARTALVDGNSTGTANNIIMQRYLASGGYKYFSSPFSNATVSQFAEEVKLNPTIFPRFYGYNEDDTETGWFNHTDAADPLVQMEGYAVNFGRLDTILTVNIAGNANNGPFSRTLYNRNYTYTQGFNLIGNPYPSPIDWDSPSGWTKTNIDAALYFFKSGGADIYSGTYYYYVAPGISTGGASNIIPSMQAFFVHVTDGGFPVTGTLAMDNSVRIKDHVHSFIKSDPENFPPVIKISAAYSDSPSAEDPVVIYFHEKGTGNFDSRLDAMKLINTDVGTPNLYTITDDGYRLAINALSQYDFSSVIPIGLKTDHQGVISIKLTEINNIEPGTGIYLHDEASGSDRMLEQMKTINISLPAGECNDRFSIRFITKGKDVPDNWPGQDLLNAYASHGKLIAEINILSGNHGNLSVINLSGQTMFRKDIYNLSYHEFDLPLRSGIYIINYVTGKLSASRKIVILK